MKKVFITQEQNDEIEKLIEVALSQGVDEDIARSKILETHIRKGWEGSEIKSLGSLTSDELAKVLFSENFEIKKEKIKLQEYEVIFKVRKSTKLSERIIKNDSYKLSDEEVVNLALQHLGEYVSYLKLNKESVLECKVVKIIEN